MYWEMSMSDSRKIGAIEEAFSQLEVDAFGIASVSDLPDKRLRDQVLALLPGACSIVALANEIYPEVLDHSRPDKLMGEASPRDMLVPHMDYLNGRLTKAAYDVAKACRRQGLKALPMPPAGIQNDQRFLRAILSYKHAAEAAGLGTIGRHSLLVTPQFGPRVRLGCVITEAALPPTPRIEESLCSGCNLCVEACPSKALAVPSNGEIYSINKFACSAFRGGAGPCSECMKACPKGR